MVKWTPKSQDDLFLIQDHIASNFNVDIAIKITEELVDFTEQALSQNPLVGRVLESNPLFSCLVYKGNSIYYCENPKDRDLYIVYIVPRRTKTNTERLNANEVA